MYLFICKSHTLRPAALKYLHKKLITYLVSTVTETDPVLNKSMRTKIRYILQAAKSTLDQQAILNVDSALN